MEFTSLSLINNSTQNWLLYYFSWFDSVHHDVLRTINLKDLSRASS